MALSGSLLLSPSLSFSALTVPVIVLLLPSLNYPIRSTPLSLPVTSWFPLQQTLQWTHFRAPVGSPKSFSLTRRISRAAVPDTLLEFPSTAAEFLLQISWWSLMPWSKIIVVIIKRSTSATPIGSLSSRGTSRAASDFPIWLTSSLMLPPSLPLFASKWGPILKLFSWNFSFSGVFSRGRLSFVVCGSL